MKVHDKTNYSPVDLVMHGIQLGDALVYLHDKRIYHSDVKPANVLIDAQSRYPTYTIIPVFFSFNICGRVVRLLFG